MRNKGKIRKYNIISRVNMCIGGVYMNYKKIMSSILASVLLIGVPGNNIIAAAKKTVNKSLYDTAYKALVKADKINGDFEEEITGALGPAVYCTAKYNFSKQSDCVVLNYSELMDGGSTIYANYLHNPKKIKVYSVKKGDTQSSVLKQNEIDDYFKDIIHNTFTGMDAKLIKKIVYSSKINSANNKITINLEKVPSSFIGEIAKELGEDNKLYDMRLEIVIDKQKLSSVKIGYKQKDEEIPEIEDVTTLCYQISYRKQNIKPYNPAKNEVRIDPFKSSLFKLDDKKEAEVNQKAKDIINEIIKPSMKTDLERYIVIYKYLQENTQYNYIDYVKNGGKNSNEYELLINGYGLEYSYAQALRRLCNLAGIQCEIVTGRYQEKNHIWNAVKINGKWSYTDIASSIMENTNDRNLNNIIFADAAKYRADKTRSDGKIQNYNNPKMPDIFNDESKLFLMYRDGYLYYSIYDKKAYKCTALCKCKCDGSDNQILNKDFSNYCCYENNIFCINFLDDEYNDGTYKISLDGKKIVKLSDKALEILDVSDGWIYYDLGEMDGLYRMKLDGISNSKISSKDPVSIYINKNYIYLIYNNIM